MEAAHRKYLAEQIISEHATISYRSVARALKTHVNAAKRILYEFYEHENSKKPGSVHATYLIAGTKKTPTKTTLTNRHANGLNEDDEPIPSSPPPFTSSMLQSSQHDGASQASYQESVPVKSVTLVREEGLGKMKEKFETITSIHIYSLSPHRLQDLQTLTDIGRDLFATVFVKEDPLQHNKTYGVIQNSDVRRRSAKRPPPVEAPAAVYKPEPTKPKQITDPATGAKTTAAPPTLKKEDSHPNSAGSSAKASTSKPTTLKRDTSDIFKSFSKAKSKPKSESQASAADSPAASGPEDAVMPHADEEGESEDEALFLDTNTRKPAKKRTSDEGPSQENVKEERAAKLRKMMDSDDEEMAEMEPVKDKAADLAETAKEKHEEADADADGDKEVAWSDSDTEETAIKKENENEGQSTEPKRRRGRRKVMKKRTMKDEEGYLVTKEEAAWESFSEDEVEVKPKPKTVFPTTKVKSEAKGGKATGKTAAKSGNIASFFGKR